MTEEKAVVSTLTARTQMLGHRARSLASLAHACFDLPDGMRRLREQTDNASFALGAVQEVADSHEDTRTSIEIQERLDVLSGLLEETEDILRPFVDAARPQ